MPRSPRWCASTATSRSPAWTAVLRWADDARARLAEIDVSDEAIAELRRRRATAAARARPTAPPRCRAPRRAAARELGGRRHRRAGRAGDAAGRRSRSRSAHGRPTRGSPVLTVELDGDRSRPRQVRTAWTRSSSCCSRTPAPRRCRSAAAHRAASCRASCSRSRCAWSAATRVPTLVFDEVDAGVGGRAAVEVGRRLARLARGRQVFVVTHLAQVAAYADRHVVVDKPLEAATRRRARVEGRHHDERRPAGRRGRPRPRARPDARRVRHRHRPATTPPNCSARRPRTARRSPRRPAARPAVQRRGRRRRHRPGPARTDHHPSRVAHRVTRVTDGSIGSP